MDVGFGFEMLKGFPGFRIRGCRFGGLDSRRANFGRRTTGL